MFTATPFRTSRTWKQPRCPSTDEKKMRYIYTKEYYSAIKRNTLESVLMSKVRERINIVFQCTYMESRKMVLKNIFTGQQWRKRYKEQTYRYGERGGEGEMYGKSNMETYITTCKIDNQWEFALWLRKLKQGLCNNLAGWDGEEDGREIQKGGVYAYLWLILVEVWQKTTKLCKAIILQ